MKGRKHHIWIFNANSFQLSTFQLWNPFTFVGQLFQQNRRKFKTKIIWNNYYRFPSDVGAKIKDHFRVKSTWWQDVSKLVGGSEKNPRGEYRCCEEEVVLFSFAFTSLFKRNVFLSLLVFSFLFLNRFKTLLCKVHHDNLGC